MMARWAFLCTVAMTGCAGTTPATQDPSSLVQPPTAIEVLVTRAGDLQLRKEQSRALEALDHKLAVMNEPLERRIAEVDRGDAQRTSKRVDHSTGRDRMTILTAERERIAEAKRRAEITDGLRAQMAYNHEVVLAEAFNLLDVDQRDRARPILEDSGFDPPAVSRAAR